jgi:predicted transposase/invertase (TIGR01784 family)
MSLLVNNHPREFLKKYKSYCALLEKGVWELNFNFAKVTLIELQEIGLKGLDRLFLGNFSIDSVFQKVLEEVNASSQDSTKSKRIDTIKNIIYHRVASFEKDPEIRRKYMATVYEADITDLVKPHLENAKKEGKLEGIVEGKLEGKLEKALETARKMREIGLSLEVIEKSVGLSEEELKDNGIF